MEPKANDIVNIYHKLCEKLLSKTACCATQKLKIKNQVRDAVQVYKSTFKNRLLAALMLAGALASASWASLMIAHL
jgi:hypothetical protein